MSLQSNTPVSFSEFNRGIRVTNGNMGIGTTSPNYKLDVAGSIRTTSTTGLLIGTSTDTNRFISALDSSMGTGTTKFITFGRSNDLHNQAELGFSYTDTGNTTNSLTLGLYGYERMRVRADGYVGIGTTAPRSNLEITQTSSTTGVMLFSGSDDSGINSLMFNHSNHATLYQKAAIQTRALGVGNFGRAHFGILVNTSGDSTNASWTDARVFVHGSSGNVGINTTTPTYRLDVAGSLRATSGDVTLGTLLATTSVSSGTVNATNVTATNVTVTSLVGTTVSAGTAVATTYTGGSISLSGNSTVAGTTTLAATTINGDVRVAGATKLTAYPGFTLALDSSGTEGGSFIVKSNMVQGSTQVGINNQSPSSALDVSGSITLQGNMSAPTITTKPSIYHRADVGMGIFSDYHMSFQVNGASSALDAMRITSTGLVGIGTVSPSTTLDVNGTINATNLVATTSTIGTSRITTALLALGNSNTVGSIFTTGGNVGISTTGPGAKLTVYRGNGVNNTIPTTTTDNSTIFAFLNQDDGSGSLGYGLIGGVLSSSGLAWLQSKYTSTSGTLPMALQPLGGYVGIGTGTTAPSQMFHMNGANGSVAGPHTWVTTSADSYPVFQQLNFAHDNVALNFDMYYDGTWRNSTTGVGFRIYKIGSSLNFGYGSTSAAGEAQASNTTALIIGSTGNIGISTSTPVVPLHVEGASFIRSTLLVGTSISTSNLIVTNATIANFGLTSINVTSITTGGLYISGTCASSFINSNMLTAVSGTISSLQSSGISAGSALLGNSNFSFSSDSDPYARFGGSIVGGTGDARLNVQDRTGNCISFYAGTTKQGGITAAGGNTSFNFNSGTGTIGSMRFGDANTTSFYPGHTLAMDSSGVIGGSFIVKSNMTSTSVRVGIGNSNPDYPLHVSPFLSVTYDPAFFIDGPGVINPGTQTGLFSARFEGSVQVYQLWSSSDARAKTNISDINDPDSLSILRQIEPKTFSFIDDSQNENSQLRVNYGFIAQQIETVLPDAVSKTSSFIPTILETCDTVKEFENDEFIGTRLSLVTKTIPETWQIGMIVRIVNSAGNNIEVTIKSINNNTFVVNENLDDPKYFVYGERVTDFRVLHKDVIFAITTAAVQEIDRQLQQEREKVSTLQQQYQDLLDRITNLESQ